jgi:hypothetical protein
VLSAFGALVGLVIVISGFVALFVLMEREVRQERTRADEYHDQLIGLYAAIARDAGERKQHGPVDGDDVMRLPKEVVSRLLDVGLPKRDERDAREDDRPGSPAEYEPPIEQVRDWTDPFIGLEREMVGGLRPGEGIPGIGADGGGFDDHPMANGLLPDDGEPSDDRARWQDIGEEVGEQWLESRER